MPLSEAERTKMRDEHLATVATVGILLCPELN